MNTNNLSPLQQACKKFFDIDIDYFENIQRDGETLPEVKYHASGEKKRLAIGYRDDVIEAFKQDIGKALTPEALAAATLEERLAVLREINKIRDPQISEEALQELYDRADRQTVLEKLSSANKADIIAFVHALQDVTVWECKKLLESYLLK